MRKKIIIGIAIALAVALIATYFLSRREGRTEITQSATVSRATVRKVLDATGIIKPEVGAIVKTGTRFTGIIRTMHVKVGDKVKAGQIIAEIDDREQRAQQDQAEATLRRTKADLAKTEASYPLQIREAEAQVAAAQADYDYAALNLKRRRTLVDQDLDARNTLDEATQQAETTANTLAARKATLDRLQRESTLAIKSAREAVQEAQSALEATNVRLSYSVIRAPLDGVVSEVTAQGGETVVAGFQVANLITVLDPTRLEMWIYVDETDVGQVAPGMAVEFRVDSLPGRTFGGTVNQIYPQPEIRDNIVYYRALVRLTSQTSTDLRPEMTTQCRIVVQQKDNVLAVPNEALKWVGGEQVVFVQGDGAIRRVRPRIGLAGAETSEVLEGLAEGDVVGTRVVLPASRGGARTEQASGGPGGGGPGSGRPGR
ncbi:efflux RND transporter periplasmic adaptor subunit [Nitratidesulfovibrio termitidis]|uniref:efflux RND transporter periplasmic adaptor subunit n=1 Tax=Nitratidesulfovibrio termitidis TaxID=42252 RepID=UPI0003FD0301|nr:efflux RND transporter periplasmic adaptor subunit [Nitratidesulfovibrio termitidis]